LREVQTGPRRPGHFLTRVAFLGSLWVIAITVWLTTLDWSRAVTLGDTARFGPLLFQILTYVQLALVLFFSALSCASAIAKEKDRRTFVLLLMTDMSDSEIVLGKILGSLLPLFAQIILSVPLLMMLMLLGGTSLEQVIQAALVLLATALAAGSLGGLVALWRDKTFQALALTTLILVFYLLLVRGTALLTGQEWVQQWFGPFQAMRAAHMPRLPGEEVGLAPAYGFVLCMIGLATVINGVGLWGLRRWNPSGEPIMQRERPEDAVDRERGLADEHAPLPAGGTRVDIHAAPGEARQVAGNPILWREIFTQAYGNRPILIKLAYFVVLALVCYPALYPVFTGAPPNPWLAAWGLVPVSVLSLLLVTAQATTAITSERDTGALDLLLVTDLTAQEFIFGKLLGIVYNTKEFLLPPLILAAVYGFYGRLATPPLGHPEYAGVMNATAMVCVVGACLVLLSFAAVLGVHVALRNQNSQVAIIHSLSTIFFLTVGTGVCIWLIVINRQFEYQWGSFVFFLIAGVGGLWYVLSGGRPSTALTWASWFCPLAVLYAVMNVLVAKPGSQESADPLVPFLVIGGAFGFAMAAMLVPLLSEFDVAMGRTSGGAD
jgi:ABC-type Na+ efflux pump permease subunit